MSDIEYIREEIRKNDEMQAHLGLPRCPFSTALHQAAEALEDTRKLAAGWGLEGLEVEMKCALSTIAKTLGKNNEES